MEYLVFRLYGPMASWGEPAVGSDRPSALRPTRSALLGLVAAALGIKREEQAQHDKLNASLRFAIKQISAGVLLRDFHTAQVPSHDRKSVLRTRKDELKGDKLNTVLSSRDYRSDGLWIVAVEVTDNGKWDIRQIQQALLKPKFTLYLGRKSCPLAAPLSPQLTSTDDLQAALDIAFEPLLGSIDEDRMWLPKSERAAYYWQEGMVSGSLRGVSSNKVWDEPVHRGRWQFTSRVEHSASMQREKP